VYEAWERCKKRDFHTEGKNSENWRIKAADILEGLQDQTTSYNTGIFRPDQWRSQTFIFGGANRTPKARDHLGWSGGMHPRENFEI
jgi:hypothetical protein